MKQAKISILTFIVFLFLLGGGVFLLDYLKDGFIDNVTIINAEPYDLAAGTGDNVYGWAWNETVGWIGFNSAGCDINKNGFVDSGNCGGDDATVSVVPYGVDIARDGTIRGNAWSEVVGYIEFNPPGPYPDGSGSATLMDVSSRDVTGWARICSLSNDPANCSGGNGLGWISMSSSTATVPYGVSLLEDNTFSGYAWSDDIGWISFGSINCDANRDGVGDGGDCGTGVIADYRVGVVTNVSGYAWNDTYGWFSFNCANSGAGDCGGSFYGVNITDDEKVVGYAWSTNLGWVCFGETCQSATADYSVCSNDPDKVCLDSTDCSGAACEPWLPDVAPDSNPTSADLSGADLTGWANILSFGNNGWIKLDDDDIFDGDISDDFDYGVSLSGDDFEGFAFNKQSGVGAGWISFNCNEGGASGEDICATVSDYKVSYSSYFNTSPQATGLTAPNWSAVEACYTGYDAALGARLKWNFIDPDGGAYAAAYRVVVKRPNDSVLLDTGKCTDLNACNTDDTACNTYDCIIDLDGLHFTDGETMTYDLYSNPDDDDLGTDILSYGQSYKWEVTVWDNNDASSTVAVYDSDGGVGGNGDTDNDDNNVPTFKAYNDEFPNPENFTWFAPDPSALEMVMFESADSAKYYSGATELGCNDANCDWLWSFVAPTTGTIADDTASTTEVQFDEKGSQSIELTLTDTNGYSCSTSTGVDIKAKLPLWIEGN